MICLPLLPDELVGHPVNRSLSKEGFAQAGGWAFPVCHLDQGPPSLVEHHITDWWNRKKIKTLFPKPATIWRAVRPLESGKSTLGAQIAQIDHSCIEISLKSVSNLISFWKETLLQQQWEAMLLSYLLQQQQREGETHHAHHTDSSLPPWRETCHFKAKAKCQINGWM